MLKLMFVFSAVFFLLTGCESVPKPKPGEENFTEIFMFNLDSAGKKEIIEVKKLPHESLVMVRSMDNKPIGEFRAPGVFKKIEFVEMNMDGNKQIVLYYKTGDLNNLVIYKIKNNDLEKMFLVEGACTIDVDFDTYLSRIKFTKRSSDEVDCLHAGARESWIWDGERFLKEYPITS